MPRYASEITKEKLFDLLVDAIGDDFRSIKNESGKLKQIAKDLSKVSFDLENYSYKPSKDPNRSYLGPKTIGNLAVIGCYGGGDWEYPVSFFIYLDKNGKTLRAYIPEDGNPWNTATKKAYGNDENQDNINIQKQMKKQGIHNENEFLDPEDRKFYDADDADILLSINRMFEDISKRVVVK